MNEPGTIIPLTATGIGGAMVYAADHYDEMQNRAVVIREGFDEGREYLGTLGEYAGDVWETSKSLKDRVGNAISSVHERYVHNETEHKNLPISDPSILNNQEPATAMDIDPWTPGDESEFNNTQLEITEHRFSTPPRHRNQIVPTSHKKLPGAPKSKPRDRRSVSQRMFNDGASTASLPPSHRGGKRSNSSLVNRSTPKRKTSSSSKFSGGKKIKASRKAGRDYFPYEGMEFVGIVRGNEAGSTYLNRPRLINPGLRSEFPQLHQTAADFEQYRFKSLSYHYQTTCASLSTTNSSTGTINFGTQYNVDSKPFTSLDESLACEWASVASITRSMERSHVISCDAKSLSGSPVKNIRTGEITGNNNDATRYDHCQLNIAVADTPMVEGDANSMIGLSVGQLWVKYEVEFYKPRLWTGLGNTIQTWQARSDKVKASVDPVAGAWVERMLPAENSVDKLNTFNLNLNPDTPGISQVPLANVPNQSKFMRIRFDDSQVGSYTIKWTGKMSSSKASAEVQKKTFHAFKAPADTVVFKNDMRVSFSSAKVAARALIQDTFASACDSAPFECEVHVELRRARSSGGNYIDIGIALGTNDGEINGTLIPDVNFLFDSHQSLEITQYNVNAYSTSTSEQEISGVDEDGNLLVPGNLSVDGYTEVADLEVHGNLIYDGDLVFGGLECDNINATGTVSADNLQSNAVVTQNLTTSNVVATNVNTTNVDATQVTAADLQVGSDNLYFSYTGGGSDAQNNSVKIKPGYNKGDPADGYATIDIAGNGTLVVWDKLYVTSDITTDTSVIVNHNAVVGNAIGIGTMTPESALHITGQRATTPTQLGLHAGEGGTDNYGMEICSSATGDSVIDFTVPNQNRKGRILYDNVTEEFKFLTDNNYKMTLSKEGYLNVNLNSTRGQLLYLEGERKGNLDVAGGDAGFNFRHGDGALSTDHLGFLLPCPVKIKRFVYGGSNGSTDPTTGTVFVFEISEGPGAVLGYAVVDWSDLVNGSYPRHRYTGQLSSTWPAITPIEPITASTTTWGTSINIRTIALTGIIPNDQTHRFTMVVETQEDLQISIYCMR